MKILHGKHLRWFRGTCKFWQEAQLPQRKCASSSINRIIAKN